MKMLSVIDDNIFVRQAQELKIKDKLQAFSFWNGDQVVASTFLAYEVCVTCVSDIFLAK